MLRIGLLIGTPRACIEVEKYLLHQYPCHQSGHESNSGCLCNISFVSYHADMITQCMFGLTKDDYFCLSQIDVSPYSSLMDKEVIQQAAFVNSNRGFDVPHDNEDKNPPNVNFPSKLFVEVNNKC